MLRQNHRILYEIEVSSHAYFCLVRSSLYYQQWLRTKQYHHHILFKICCRLTSPELASRCDSIHVYSQQMRTTEITAMPPRRPQGVKFSDSTTSFWGGTGGLPATEQRRYVTCLINHIRKRQVTNLPPTTYVIPGLLPKFNVMPGLPPSCNS